ncbi:FAD-dependent oxidoreductase, partial [Streptomyces sp. NPDC050211]|uniref:FAD-dependent oxidoreductase n=1 Tax=Streptomyces sp. NPDC050211 TaxID=3154932 RepID=UPI0034468908
MLEPAYQADVVIVGAGVAGLSAAHRLTSAGVTTAVLEAAPYVGGRMSTEKVDGFRLDRIGQLLSTSYPELGLTPGLDALVLRPFAPGVLVHSGGVRHRAGAPANGGGARGALHAVRALASAPLPNSVRALAGGPSPTSAPLGRSTPPGTPRNRTAAPRPRTGAPLGTAVDQARLAASLARLAGMPVERQLS